MKKYDLSVLTPVHIGSGEKLQNDIEFFISNKVYAKISPERVLERIGKDRVHDWVTSIEQGVRLENFLNNNGIPIEPSEIGAYSFAVKDDLGSSRETRVQLKDPWYNGMIPGSSVKGSLRTALWSSEVPRDEIDIRAISRRGRNRTTFSGNDLMREKFSPRADMGDAPNKDLLRFLRLGDAVFSGHSMGLHGLKVLSFRENGWRLKEMEEYAECIASGGKAEFSLGIDRKGLKTNVDAGLIPADLSHKYLASEEGLLSVVHEYTKTMIREDIEFFNADLNLDNDLLLNTYLDHMQSLLKKAEEVKDGALLRLGHGSGYNFMTGNKIRSKNISEDDVEAIYRQIRRDKQGRYDDYLFVKSRKITKGGLPMGFVMLTPKRD